ncbi:DUF1636 domain-containing protein [Microcoleus sp. FACHB-1515]|uniref:DUF1636 family protein n=1 Tax=Cyanophyceae TaxID=3028117 RepID=UPI00168300C1|nr:DUF1636 domain-containing protein [Microcoleus sp. FACHB-1515]MBD2091397.1 DUF1636 domain-containing protein [Microcoleus sp. FACHB-1515]
MTIHTLFVCTSCVDLSHEGEVPADCTEGNQLFLKLLAAQQDNSACPDLNIEAVDCLGTCDRPCSVSLVCPHKYTFHYVDVLSDQGAIDLLRLCKLYIDRKDGDLQLAEMPRSLRSKLLVCIPPPALNNQ